MRTRLLCGAAAVAIITAAGGPALAADLPVKAPPPAMFSWTGFYIGGHVGIGSGKFDFSTGPAQGSHSGAVGGLQLGYNWQTGNVVWGLEGDVSAANLHAGDPFVVGMEAKVDLLASLRGRLGLAFDRVLVYATGGAAYVHGKADAQTFGALLSTNFGNFRGVVGGGVEWAATNNVSIRVEALDYLGNSSFDVGGDLGNKIGNIWVARVGANVRF